MSSEEFDAPFVVYCNTCGHGEMTHTVGGCVIGGCSCNGFIGKTLRDEHDPVNHPKHYNSHPSGIECITVTRHMNFNLGNVVKYLWRAGIKGEETTIEDLEKAAWYLNDEIEKRKKEA